MRVSVYRTIMWVLLFSLAMAFLETAVVVYLRKLYYPEGFSFPLKVISNDIALTEFIREIATMVMLIGIGILAGRTGAEKFAYFILSFAVWDIFYYVFLKLLLNWPESLLTWDILFMLPLTWVGPVIAPVINSITMIMLAGVIIYITEKKRFASVGIINWGILIVGSLVVIISYTLDYIKFMLEWMNFFELFNYKYSEDIIEYTTQYIPGHFQWYLFLIGVVIHLSAIGNIIARNRHAPIRVNNTGTLGAIH